jgi:hypothetical protein
MTQTLNAHMNNKKKKTHFRNPQCQLTSSNSWSQIKIGINPSFHEFSFGYRFEMKKKIYYKLLLLVSQDFFFYPFNNGNYL